MNKKDISIINQFHKESNEVLKNIFKNKIKQSFLIDILYKVKENIGIDVYKYFDLSINDTKIITGDFSSIEYDICRTIVGIHRSNIIFMSDYERAQLEKKTQYKDELVNDVVQHLKIRQYSAHFFRKNQIKGGEEFIYFPLLYKVFALCTKSLENLFNNNDGTGIYRFYINIMDKSIAVLSLIEDNFLDNAYPICRSVIEIYIKLLLIEQHPQLLEKHEKFSLYDLNKTCCSIEYPEEFETAYFNKKNQREKSKINFLHYGWVDNLDDYHNIVTKNPYSINGIIDYLSRTTNNDYTFEIIRTFYRMCHSYTHGNVGISKYPLLHYFELSIILGTIVPHTYELLVNRLNCDNKILDVDILDVLSKDYQKVFEQYQKKSTENFELFYKDK